MFLLESTRFVIPLVPGITPVQGAAMREFLIAALLIVMLRYKPSGLVPEDVDAATGATGRGRLPADGVAGPPRIGARRDHARSRDPRAARIRRPLATTKSGQSTTS